MLKKEAKRKQWGISAVQPTQRTCLNYYLWVDGVFRWAKSPEEETKEEIKEEVKEEVKEEETEEEIKDEIAEWEEVKTTRKKK